MAFHDPKMSSIYLAPPPLVPSPFKVDEGYSEDSRSQAGSVESDSAEAMATDALDPHAAHLAAAEHWLLSLPPEMRAGLARTLLLSLPNPAISDIVQEANQRLHFDPAVCLPSEIVSYIFSYLDAPTLIRASLVSKTWNAKATDIRLWRRLFSQEGWAINHDSVRILTEAGENKVVAESPRRHKIRPRSTDILAESPTLKRARDATYPADAAAESSLGWSEQHGHVEADTPPDAGSDHESLSESLLHHGSSMNEDLEMAEADELNATRQSLRGQLLTQQDQGVFKPNWQYLYNQRRRLEQNWINGRFTNFRLPRKEAQHQAHTQCVYTVQYSNRYVVSGSRDKSVRVWDIDTQELKMPPLEGHTGSVLCLQFDERPSQDVIISGGSDADIIVWRFSTGEIIRRLHKAHTDSVLNLRFDERYLVTCSKDKTIRIWNRKELIPTDPEYPDRGDGAFRNAQYPDHIIPIPRLTEDVMIYQPSFNPLPLYSLLMTFDGHAAAVNAIQIYKDEVVSASGDRKIMLWNIRNGTLTRTYAGHTKGIACVQYDGRRIVSGSSDNTVRIFDSSTAAEVAMLEGHRNLVRTVQAEFGDLPGDAELQEAEARENDRRLDNTARTRNPRMLPHAKPWLERYFVYGAKLPPGGGGNRWSKIVSGSYDETVLIWRRDREGRWFIAKELKHEDAMRVASGMTARGGSHPNQARRGLRLHPTLAPAPGAGNVTDARAGGQLPPADHQQAPQAGQRPMNFAASVRANGNIAPTTSSPTTTPGQVRPSLARQGSLPGNSSPNAAPQVTHRHVMAQNVSPLQSQHRGTAHPLQPAQPVAGAHANVNYRQALATPIATANGAAPTQTMPGAWPAPQRAAAHQQQQQQAQAQPGPNSRVFKLQFDARRIICCSQEPVIIGWDFANGDEAIMEASEYFGEPS